MFFYRLYTHIAHHIPASLARSLIESGIFNARFFSLLLVRKSIKRIEYFILKSAGDDIFDRGYYLQQNPDVASEGFDPFKHFIKYGHKEGRNPCALFDVSYYREQAGLGPHFPLSELTHFLLYGADKDISPSPWFEFQYYRRRNRDVAQSKINPYRHYLRFGQQENRHASPNFDPAAYLDNHPELKRSKLPAIQLFLDELISRKNQPASASGQLYRRRHGLNSEDLIEDIELALNDLPEPASTAEPVLDVIIPVYRGKEITLRCLHSVLTAGNKTPFQLLVIDDKSPEAELSAALEKLAGRGYFKLITHEDNQGFVKSVNEGMRAHPKRDVILLNSDTEVFADWIDRLNAAAYRLANISSVTPLTNNGTICSYPTFTMDNPHPLEISYKELDAIAARVNAKHAIPAPTAVGFCMYIRRDALNEIGYFDEAAFGKGYGEENDFCQRGQRKGWLDIIAADVFVRHHGATSFQGAAHERIRNALGVIDTRYPDYRRDVERFIAVDPLRKARSAIDLSRLCGLKKDKNTLIISHQRGGGTEQYILEEARRLERSGHSLFRLFAKRNHSDIVHLTHMDAPDVPNLSGFHLEADRDQMVAMLRELEIGEVLVHHLFELSAKAPALIHELLKRAGISYSFMVHDYLSICPRTNLVGKDGVYCAEPDKTACRICLAEAGSEFNVADTGPWREQYDRFLSDAKQVVAPDKDVRDRMKRYFPQANIVTIPHDETKPAPLKLRKRPAAAPIRIGVVGAISPIKGFDVLVRCARHIRKKKLPIELVVVGYTKNDMLARNSGIEVTGPYTNNNVLELIAKSDLDMIFLPALWPETFSYTLSVALQSGLPMAAFDIGAIGRRLEGLPHAHILPLATQDNPARILKQLSAFLKKLETPNSARPIGEMLAENIIRPDRFRADMENLEPSNKDYVIFFTPRSGSTFLTALLSSTKQAGFPEEWFNPNWVAKVAARFNAAELGGYIEMLKRHKKTPNGVFGAELSFFHYAKVAEDMDFFSYFPTGTAIFILIREDIILQGISLYKATETDLFHSPQTTLEEVRCTDKNIQYDGKKIRFWIDHIHRQEMGFLKLINERKLKPLFITYENMFALDRKELLKRIFDHIGISLPRDIKIEPPPHRKIGTKLNDDFKARFVRENAAFIRKINTGRKPLLEHPRLFTPEPANTGGSADS